MTHPTSLVLEGNEVKLRLQAERVQTGSPVPVSYTHLTLPTICSV